MDNYQLSVSAAAVLRLRQLENSLLENGKRIKELMLQLEEDFLTNQEGLGPHTDSVRQMLEEMRSVSQQAQYEHNRLALKVRTCAMLRQSLLQESPYRQIPEEVRDVARFRGEMYSTYCRKLRQPQTVDAGGTVKGHWDADVFVPDPAYVPTRHNPERQSFQEITRTLQRDYGITMTGIPYRDGYGDFSGISLAQVDWQDVARARMEKDPSLCTQEGPDHERIFGNRSATAKCADALAAARGLKIGDLPAGYTAGQLQKWREDNGFSWEESIHHGYLLVPTVVHGNISHTGLVGIMTKEGSYTRRFAQKVQASSGVSGKLRIRPDGIGKVIYRGKGLRLHRNGRY